MINIGVIGLGMMGSTHLDVYANHPLANVVAVCDIKENILKGEDKAQGNIEGQAEGGFDFQAPGLKKYTDAMQLINDPKVQLVDICLPTPDHVTFGTAALEAGKHLLMEKPLGRNAQETQALIDAASKAKGMSMCAMCMRFWPGWDWLKQQVENQTYGKVLAATFRRVTSHPARDFYMEGDSCGGAILDLHIHDTDFIKHLFGMPKAVYSAGYPHPTTRTDHVVTHYQYDDIPLVVAEGGWTMTDGYGFTMQYTVNFENATAVFDLAQPQPLKVIQKGQEPQVILLATGMGYEYELDYLLQCLDAGKQPDRVTFADAADAVKIVNAEAQSIASGQIVSLA